MSGWDVEAALDIQSAYTMALGANIYLIQSINNSFASIMSSIDWCNKNKIDIITPFSLKNGTLFDLYNKKYLLL
jgi:subtilase family serine protease